ncbi:MAG TPA: UDP-N-acetylmuramoyl-L-alanine--D-glutamate ligase [Gaiellaceae bacterium]|nr:UDP-N-acetylmuramoyl-L-alanine--D-glutamate ligase [Gaiellaceae bacterium]
MNALVLGLARSGHAAALALARRGDRVVGVDRSTEVDSGRLEAAGVEVRLGSEEPSLVDGMDVLIKSPGVPADAPLVAAARERGLPVWSEVELGFRLLPNPILGVTGTNGKTTTSELLGAMLRTPVAGNVGRALTELDRGVAPDDWVVCELSSFQLEDIEQFRPRIAVLLNLEPDHLDRHGTFEAYRDAKLRIFENQGGDDVAVVPRGFRDVGEPRRIEFSADDPLPAEPRMPGAHNRENAAAATAAARAAGVSDEQIAGALRSFPGVPHRLEQVAEVGGVRYVNDSKATNAAAARRAIASYDAPLHVILGGLGKNESYDELAADLRAKAARAYLIGAAADELAAALDIPFERSGDLAAAVRAAAAAARPGDVVLLSPACASYDQFENFEARGDEFRRLVEELT